MCESHTAGKGQDLLLFNYAVTTVNEVRKKVEDKNKK